MYDWANSAFVTTVVTTFLGPYLESLAKINGGVQILGRMVEPGAFFPACVSISVVMQVLFLPLLGTIVDSTGLKKRLLLTAAYIGAVATMLLFFIRTDMPLLGTNGAVLLGGLLLIIANLAFGAAIVAYNAYLPDIAAPHDRDATSSRGFAMGYLGGALLLAGNLVLLQTMTDTGLAVRISLASAGVWWLVFTYFYPHRRLRQHLPRRILPPGESYLSHGVKELLHTLGEMRRKYPETLRYLIAYLIYNDGIQTVIVVATLFAASELGATASTLVLLVLLIQIVAIGGALAFGRLALVIGAKRSILISLVIWSLVVIYAYALLYEQWQLWILGVVVALVLGGSQALSRSLFSQMIPRDKETEYFGFYEISERGTSWIGTALFALAVQMTGSTRVALISLIVFFVAGLILLPFVNVRKAILESGNDPNGVVL
jgi:UMF1 family MFS transporter